MKNIQNMKGCKLIALLLVISIAISSAKAIEKDTLIVTPFSPHVNVKMSVLAAIGIINPAVEFSLNHKWSMQMEGMGVFAGNNFLGTGYPLQLGTFFVEGRYYFKHVFNGFFVAPNVGLGAFRLNKNILHKFFGWSSDLDYKKNENSVQTGANVMGGLTLGYVYSFKKNPHWAVEINWSFGRQWARYEDHLYDTEGNPLEHVPVNGSAEYMPFYRGGFFITYKW